MATEAREVRLQVHAAATRARGVEGRRTETGLQLIDVVGRAAECGAESRAIGPAVFGLERIDAVLEIVRARQEIPGEEIPFGVFGAARGVEAARTERELVARRHLGADARGGIPPAPIERVLGEHRDA